MADQDTMNRHCRVITCPRWSGLERALAEEVENLKAPDPLRPVVILVGSHLLKLYLSRRLAERSKSSGLNLRLLTFRELAESLARAARLDGMPPRIPSGGRELIMHRVADGIKSSDYFYSVASARGFREAALAAYRDVCDGRLAQALRPRGIEQAAEWAAENSREKLKSFFELIARAEKKRRGFSLDHDFYERAAEVPQTFRETYRTDLLITYGFYDFTSAQWNLLEALSQEVSMISFMPHNESGEAFEFATKTRNRYERAGFRLEKIECDSKEDSSLEAVKKYFGTMEGAGESRRGDGSFKVIAAPGEDREVKAVTREIMRLVKEDGIRYHEIGIIMRNSETYARLFEETLGAYDVPCFINGGLPLSRFAFSKSLIKLLGLSGSDYKRTDVMEFLCSGNWNTASLGQEAGEDVPFRFDLLSREARVISGREEWTSRLSALREAIERDARENSSAGEKSQEEVLDKVRDIEMLLGFIEMFFKDLDSLNVCKTWKDIASRFMELISKYIKLEGEHKRIIESILEGLCDLDFVDDKADMELFRLLFSKAIDRESLPTRGYQEGCVCLSDLMPARGVRFKVLFIPGMVEKSFPRHLREDPILLDEERKLINSRASDKGAFLAVKGEQALEENLLFQLSLDQAEAKLILSYPWLDPESNRERVPSFFLLGACETLAGKRLRFEDLKEELEFSRRIGLAELAAGNESECLDARDRDLFRIILAQSRSEHSAGTYIEAVNNFAARGAAAMDSRLRVGTLTRFDGYVNSKQTRDMLEGIYKSMCAEVSPSRLEKWAECPFRYFLEHVIRVNVVEVPGIIWEISPADRGTFMHRALEGFFGKLKSEGMLPLTEQNLEKLDIRLESEVKELSNEYEAFGITGWRPVWEVRREDIAEDLAEVIRAETASEDVVMPEEFEKPFRVPLTLPGGESVMISGKMDRLDRSESGLRVIDYKSGSAADFKDNSFYKKDSIVLQLPVYLYAALAAYNLGDPSDSMAEYFFITRKQNFKRVIFDGNDWQEKLDKLREIISIILAGVRDGLFMPWRDRCANCDFKLACFRPDMRWIEKKSQDNRAAARSALAEDAKDEKDEPR